MPFFEICLLNFFSIFIKVYLRISGHFKSFFSHSTRWFTWSWIMRRIDLKSRSTTNTTWLSCRIMAKTFLFYDLSSPIILIQLKIMNNVRLIEKSVFDRRSRSRPFKFHFLNKFFKWYSKYLICTVHP